METLYDHAYGRRHRIAGRDRLGYPRLACGHLLYGIGAKINWCSHDSREIDERPGERCPKRWRHETLPACRECFP